MTLQSMALWLCRSVLGSSTFPMTLLTNWQEPSPGCPSVSSGGKVSIFSLSLSLYTFVSMTDVTFLTYCTSRYRLSSARPSGGSACQMAVCVDIKLWVDPRNQPLCFSSVAHHKIHMLLFLCDRLPLRPKSKFTPHVCFTVLFQVIWWTKQDLSMYCL